jgi:hypothetical protein
MLKNKLAMIASRVGVARSWSVDIDVRRFLVSDFHFVLRPYIRWQVAIEY